MTMNAARLGASITAGIDAVDPLTPTQEAAVLASMTALAAATIDEIEDYYAGSTAVSHSALNAASLAWTSSGHTGTASRVAGFSGAGAAAYYTIGTDLQAYSATLAAVAAGTYTGDDSITTLGTIATGVWQGSVIGPTYLGTGSGITTKFLRGDGTWQTVSGSGDVVGPASATDHAVARFDLTTGKLLQDSVLIVSDAGILTGGEWQGTAVADGYIASAATWNAKPSTGYVNAGDAAVAAYADSLVVGLVPDSRTVNGHALSSNVTVTKGDVGLGSVENTALSTWAGTASITTVGTVGTGVWQGTAIADSYIASAATWNAKEPAIAAGTTAQYWRGDKSWQTLDKAAVGLANVENAAASGLYVPLGRTVSTTAPLTGGGALSGNLTLAVSAATTAAAGVVELATDGEAIADRAVQGNDSRLSNARAPTTHEATHIAGGSDPFLSTDLLEAIVKRLQVTGPVTLLIGAVADGQYLKRSGTAVIGDTPAGGSSTIAHAVASDLTIAAAYSMVVARYVSISAGITLSIGADGDLEIT